jgi:hypothetical protein
MNAETTAPVVLVDITAHDWHLVIEQDGAHFTASVYRVHATRVSYRSVLNDTAEDAIDGAFMFIATHSPVTARSLRGLAAFECAQKLTP